MPEYLSNDIRAVHLKTRPQTGKIMTPYRSNKPNLEISYQGTPEDKKRKEEYIDAKIKQFSNDQELKTKK